MSSGYQKFSSRFAGAGAKPKTFASFAIFTEGIEISRRSLIPKTLILVPLKFKVPL